VIAVNAPVRTADTPATALARRQLAQVWPRKTRSQITIPAQAVGRVLEKTRAATPHGQRLKSALTPKDHAARTPADKAVLWLALRGQLPTEGAVDGRLAALAESRAAAARRSAEAREIADRDGAAVAAYAAAMLAATGHGPSWNHLGRFFGWPGLSRNRIGGQLERDGWLAMRGDPGDVRPGPRAVVPAQSDAGRAQASMGQSPAETQASMGAAS
jgi:hypothetical protein